MNQEDHPGPPDPDDVVPFFGTWRAIYTSVVVSAVVVMALLALFSGWSW